MRAVSIIVTTLSFAFALSCGGGNGDGALRDPNQDDLPDVTIQLEDLPDGFAPVEACEHQNPPPSADGSTASTFFERFENGRGDNSTCIVSYVSLTPSANDASRSIEGLDEFFAQHFEPIEGVAAECGVFQEIDALGVGEESRVFTTDCASCPGDVAQFYWTQFRVGRVLASSRLIGDECLSLSEATAYATKQTERIEAVLRADAND